MYHSKSNLHKYNTNIGVVFVDVAIFSSQSNFICEQAISKKVHTT